jgi:DnaD/phage-associated family protein
MNYIKQLNAFYDLLQSNQLNSSTQLLYHVLLMVNNKCGWLEWFQRTNQSLCGLAGVNEKTLVASRNMLKQKGLIDFIPAKKKGEITKYKIIQIYSESEVMGEKKTVQNTPNITPNITPIAGPKTTDIYKLNKTKHIYDSSCCSMHEIDSAAVTTSTVETNAIYFYEKNITKGRIGEFLRAQILNAINQYGDSLVLHALERTVSQIDNPNWKYASKILMSWAEKGIKTIEQAKNEQKPKNTTSTAENNSVISPVKPNKFLNFPQTKYNFEEIEKLEMERMIKRYEKMKAAGEV